VPGFALDVEKASREATDFLRRLLQFDTTNPPGNETACARYIAEVFGKEGIPAEVVEPMPGRGSVVARLPATKAGGAKRPLLLLSHLDVVPAVAADWKRPPFSGDLADGEIWGRGALDTKNLTALWMVVMLEAKRQRVPLTRDLIFAATADEEMGGTWGVAWLVQNRPELVDCEFALNEGGGTGIALGARTAYVYQTAEKGICWTTVTAHGKAGHASLPTKDNPVVHLAGALHRIGTTSLPMHITDTFRLFVERLGPALPAGLSQAADLLLDAATLESALAFFPDEYAANNIRAMTRNTASPTVISGSDKTNVIPQTATAQVDCRILPGQTPESLFAELRALLGLDQEDGGSPKLELTLARSSLATESPPDTELAAALGRALTRHDPDAVLVPFLVPGGTDGRFLRPQGVVCYGFCPTLCKEDNESVHGINERITVASLEFGLKVLWDALAEMVF
jgi:acetylornithine deacetylase/succinyl-diaminopimelate desuccinylase-like protein